MKDEEPRSEWLTVASKRTKWQAKAHDKKKEKQQVEHLKTSSAEVADRSNRDRKVPVKKRTKSRAK